MKTKMNRKAGRMKRKPGDRFFRFFPLVLVVRADRSACGKEVGRVSTTRVTGVLTWHLQLRHEWRVGDPTDRGSSPSYKWTATSWATLGSLWRARTSA